MKNMRCWSILKPLLSTLFGVVVFYQNAVAARSYHPHSGYLESVQGERETQYTDIVMIQPPQDEGPTLRDRIFNDKLSKEFRDRYEEKFGRTEVERVYNSPNRYTYYDDIFGFRGSVQDMNNEHRKFAEFMVRRLTEYHVDSYLKSDPTARPLWEAKERLSQIKVEVQRVQFELKYSIAGNTLDMNVINPWLSLATVTLQMSVDGFGPGPVEETIISVGRGLTTTVSVSCHYRVIDGVASFVGRKSHTPDLASSLTVSTFTKDAGRTERESLYLAGMNYSF